MDNIKKDEGEDEGKWKRRNEIKKKKKKQQSEQM